MMEKFRDEVEKVLGHEGGYVNDPDDAGGETNWGISKRAFPQTDIKNLTREGAIELYYKFYWEQYKVDLLPITLQGIYFDMTVNHGGRRAVKILQQSANSRNRKQIEVDGFIGKNTLSAMTGVELERVVSFRCLFYAKIVLKKSTQEKFWFGWFRRCIKSL